MPIIRPVSDLRNNFNEISDLCHQDNEPVFITRDGKDDIVIMSHTHYERIFNLIDLYDKLGEAEAQAAAGDEGISHSEMMRRLKAKIS